MLHGDYRKMITCVKDLKARIVQFKERDQDILDPYKSIDEENSMVLDAE